MKKATLLTFLVCLMQTTYAQRADKTSYCGNVHVHSKSEKSFRALQGHLEVRRQPEYFTLERPNENSRNSWSRIKILCSQLTDAIEAYNENVFDVKNFSINSLVLYHDRVRLNVSLTANIGEAFDTASTFKGINCSLRLDPASHYLAVHDCEHQYLRFLNESFFRATDYGAIIQTEFTRDKFGDNRVIPRQ